MCENDLKRYDFMGYPENYKDRFSNEKVPLSDYSMPITIKGRWVSRMMKMPLKSSIKSVFYSLTTAGEAFGH